MSGLILVINAGSSSVKCALIEIDDQDQIHDHARGMVEGLGQNAAFRFSFSDGKPPLQAPFAEPEAATHKDAIERILKTIDEHFGLAKLIAAGHRVVHGGDQFRAPLILDKHAIAELKKLNPLAPLHQPHNLAAIEAVQTLVPHLPQIACFDTAFHATIPTVARNFALPKALTEKGIRRYGFHGISFSYIAQHLRATEPELAHKNVVIAHLGNGASLCALKAGESVATTMGFSALDGLMMGTRSGAIDPAVIFYLMREEAMSAEAVEKILYAQSGLLGVSGLSNDMRTLRQAASTNSDARLAIAMFTYRIIREVGSMAAALGGLDGLVFTAGIGEHDRELREDVLAGLGFLGFAIDQQANARHDRVISASDSKPALVIPTNEEAMIARSTALIVARQ